MKKFSKFISALLTVLMLTGTTFVAPAVNATDTVASEAVTYTTEQRCRIGFALYFGCDTEYELSDDLTKYAIYGTAGDCTVFRRVPDMMFPVECEQVIGDYKSVSSSMFGPNDNPTAMYVLKSDNTVTSLIEAYEAGIVDMAEVAVIVPKDRDGYIELLTDDTPDITIARAELAESIRNAEVIFMEPQSYTAESLKNLEIKLAQAREVYNNETSPYDSIVSIRTLLEYAVKNLVKAVTDKAELEALLDSANGYVESKDKYTPDSYAIFSVAYEKALEEFYTGNDQSEIDKALLSLKTAISMLRLKGEPEYTLEQRCRIGYAIYSGLNVQEALNDTSAEYHIYGTTVGGCTPFRIFHKGVCYPCAIGEQTIGDYLLTSPCLYGPEDNPTGIYVMAENSTVNSMSDAYNSKEISDADMDEIYELLKKNDTDCSITHIDNTLLEESRVKLSEAITDAEAYIGRGSEFSSRTYTRLESTLNLAKSVLIGCLDQTFIDKVTDDLNAAVKALRASGMDETEEIELCCKEGYAELNNSPSEYELSDEVTYEFFGKVGNGYVFRRVGVCSSAEGYEYIGDYVSYVYSLYGDDSNLSGLYVLDEYDRVVPLSVGAENGTVRMEEVARATEGSPHGVIRLVGDADGVGGLTIKDATFIQKYLAGFDKETASMRYAENFLASDMNRDGTVNVKDVTDIQKKLVGITD